jgi:hypothetical protein
MGTRRRGEKAGSCDRQGMKRCSSERKVEAPPRLRKEAVRVLADNIFHIGPELAPNNTKKMHSVPRDTRTSASNSSMLSLRSLRGDYNGPLAANSSHPQPHREPCDSG